MTRRKARRRRRQVLHAQRRAFERFGVGFGPAENAEIVRQIQNDEATFHDRSSNRVTRWWITLAGERMLAVYDKKRKVVVSVYAGDAS